MREPNPLNRYGDIVDEILLFSKKMLPSKIAGVDKWMANF